MTKLQKQLTEIVKNSEVLEQGLVINEDDELMMIDKSLDNVINKDLDKKLNQIIGFKE